MGIPNDSVSSKDALKGPVFGQPLLIDGAKLPVILGTTSPKILHGTAVSMPGAPMIAAPAEAAQNAADRIARRCGLLPHVDPSTAEGINGDVGEPATDINPEHDGHVPALPG